VSAARTLSAILMKAATANRSLHLQRWLRDTASALTLSRANPSGRATMRDREVTST
jgi:hypothetical protein